VNKDSNEKQVLSKIVYIKHLINRLLFRIESRQSKFIKIFYNKGFGGQESVSGPGSELLQTQVIRREISTLVNKLGSKVILDAPCGDFHWMKEIKLDVERYIGVDIVPDLIERNNQKYANASTKFLVRDIVEDRLPKSDIIICRDCLVHLSFRDIFRTLKNFRSSNSKYLLTTTFTNLHENKDILTGLWRPLNLEVSPFNFPKAINIINELCSEEDGRYSDKSLGLWKIDSLYL
jgi:SAM-dependent methyltransferase